jgi:hypothetical protein
MILQSADTEYDRKLLKAVAGACKLWKELEELGIDPRKINDITTSVLSSATECSNAHKANLDIVEAKVSLQNTATSRRKVIQRAHITRKKFSLNTRPTGGCTGRN